MATIVTRAGKGSPLTHVEVDANFTNLNTGKAELASPTFTGTPAAPTATVGTSTTQVATTAFVNAEIANDAPTKTGTGASGTWGISISGDAATATNLSGNRTTWVADGVISAVIGQLAWKNYGGGHTIFDASASTAPNGGAISATDSQNVWVSSYPTLMGWNGANTYGVRVDSARIADSITSTAAGTAIAGMAFGAVGTYAFLTSATINASTSEGAVVSGSGYRYHGVGVPLASASTAVGTPQGSAPSGTWKHMGYVSGGTSRYFGGVFLRIS
jgi:hypothetical protein